VQTLPQIKIGIKVIPCPHRKYEKFYIIHN
jgi:hypothetical protein